ncbi:hypothetical protein [Phocaeicola massiliensis]
METNARTMVFDFGKDYRDSLRPTQRMTVSLMKKGGPPLYP